ncbi:endonuclease/exonuclease/phosphatase family protein [Microbacterium sp.]|uniref:endonuclease/exonuclease/phosphatase family protein n=1 Tax=Microbacterium sp. TaxID=51671 RepID=UPI002810F4A1|nr:endonuclease/exonuclease/phosphatase family protein [Microbacterium sp.]
MTAPRSTHEKQTDAIRVYTHNIYARRADWSSRRRVLIEGLHRTAPDIVLFQEEVLTAEYDQTADVLGEKWNIAHSQARSADEDSGISVASRWPLEVVAEIDLTAGGRAVDEYIWASLVVRVHTPSGPVIIANHFPEAAADGEIERQRQAVLVAQELESLASSDDAPMVIAGDFNAEPDAASLRFLTGKQPIDQASVVYVRTWDAVHPDETCVTLDPANPLVAAGLPGWPYREIDHILVRCGASGTSIMRIDACERVLDRPYAGTWASDHYGVVADLSAPGTFP